MERIESGTSFPVQDPSLADNLSPILLSKSPVAVWEANFSPAWKLRRHELEMQVLDLK